MCVCVLRMFEHTRIRFISFYSKVISMRVIIIIGNLINGKRLKGAAEGYIMAELVDEWSAVCRRW